MNSVKVRKFEVYCKLTCLGGSEKGKCSCKNPQSCKMKDDPDFELMRGAATARLLRFGRRGGLNGG